MSADQFLYKLPALHKQSVTSSSAEHRTEKGKKKIKKIPAQVALSRRRAHEPRARKQTQISVRARSYSGARDALRKRKSPRRRDIMCCFGDSGLTKQWHSLLTSNDSKRTTHTHTHINPHWSYNMHTHTLEVLRGRGLLFLHRVTEGHS